MGLICQCSVLNYLFPASFSFPTLSSSLSVSYTPISSSLSPPSLSLSPPSLSPPSLSPSLSPPSLPPPSLPPPSLPLPLSPSLSPPSLSPSLSFSPLSPPSLFPPSLLPSLPPPSLSLLLSPPLFSLFLYSMCVSGQSHHPGTHHWRGMQGRRCCVSHTPRHIFTQHMVLTITILYSCLTSVTGMSTRCSSAPGPQCSFPRIRYFYSSNSEECNPRVTWDCGNVGFATRQECETACEVNTESKF